MADKKADKNPQPQSGDKTSDEFRSLPEKKNKKEAGQNSPSLAPLLHWDAERPDDK